METKTLYGNVVAKHHLDLLGSRITKLLHDNIKPALRVILVGDDPASQIYTRKKAEKCESIGIDGKVVSLDTNTTTENLIERIETFNDDKDIHGILIQLPLPRHIDETKVLEAINPCKDVDGFHPENIGRLQLNDSRALPPCTAIGVIEILNFYNIKTEGAHAVILGRSNIVGRPLSQMLSAKNNTGNATVTLCHSRTKDISFYLKQADIIIAAIGIPLFVKGHMVKEGAIAIDVGINPTPEDTHYHAKKKIVGDIDFDDVNGRISAITPVPGGVGPMTIAMLMKNTVTAAETLSGMCSSQALTKKS